MIYSFVKGGIPMKKSYTVFKSILSVFLSLSHCLSVFLINASAGVITIIDEEQKMQYLYTFNDSVNAIKKTRPSFKYRKQSGMNTNDETYYYEIGSKTAAELSEEAEKYLSFIVDAIISAYFSGFVSKIASAPIAV